MRKAIYPNVELELVRSNLYRKDLGKKVGMSPTLIGLKLNGGSNITFKEAMEIKKALNSDMPLERLFENS